MVRIAITLLMPKPNLLLLFIIALTISSCGSADDLGVGQNHSSEPSNPSAGLAVNTPIGDPASVDAGSGNPTPIPTNARVEDSNDYYFPFLIPFDGIRPIYEPEFVNAAESPLFDEELIIGVAWGGEAKAYSITVLRFREMVDDELAGIPTLVTW